MVAKVGVLCSVDLRPFIDPPTSSFFFITIAWDYEPLRNPNPPNTAPNESQECLDWLWWWWLPLCESPVEITRAKSCLPFISPSPSSAREIDDSHLFFPPSGCLLQPSPTPETAMEHCYSPLFAQLWRPTNNKTVTDSSQQITYLENNIPVILSPFLCGIAFSPLKPLLVWKIACRSDHIWKTFFDI